MRLGAARSDRQAMSLPGKGSIWPTDMAEEWVRESTRHWERILFLESLFLVAILSIELSSFALRATDGRNEPVMLLIRENQESGSRAGHSFHRESHWQVDKLGNWGGSAVSTIGGEDGRASPTGSQQRKCGAGALLQGKTHTSFLMELRKVMDLSGGLLPTAKAATLI